MAIKECSDGNPDGTRLGQSPSDKVSFFGAVPVVQPLVASDANVAAVVAALTTLGVFRNT